MFLTVLNGPFPAPHHSKASSSVTATGCAAATSRVPEHPVPQKLCAIQLLWISPGAASGSRCPIGGAACRASSHRCSHACAGFSTERRVFKDAHEVVCCARLLMAVEPSLGGTACLPVPHCGRPWGCCERRCPRVQCLCQACGVVAGLWKVCVIVLRNHQPILFPHPLSLPGKKKYNTSSLIPK